SARTSGRSESASKASPSAAAPSALHAASTPNCPTPGGDECPPATRCERNQRKRACLLPKRERSAPTRTGLLPGRGVGPVADFLPVLGPVALLPCRYRPRDDRGRNGTAGEHGPEDRGPHSVVDDLRHEQHGPDVEQSTHHANEQAQPCEPDPQLAPRHGFVEPRLHR